MVGVDIMPYITFGYDNAQWSTSTGRFTMPAMPRGSRLETAWRTFYTEAARGGVLFHPEHHWYVGNSHTESEHRPHARRLRRRPAQGQGQRLIIP